MYIINTIPHGKCFVWYLRTRCFCIRNLTRSLRSLVRFLIRQQLVRKYRTPALSMKYSLCPAFILGHHIALSGITGVHVHVQNLLFKLFIEEDCDNMSPLVLNCSICACLHCCGHSLKIMHYCLLPFR